MRDFSIRPARRKSIYQEKKLEPDLSLIRDESSVRYECWQSLEIHVNFKVNSGYSSACGFYIFDIWSPAKGKFLYYKLRVLLILPSNND